MNRFGTMFLSWKNIREQHWRSIILALCVCAAVGMQISATLIDRSTTLGLQLGIERMGADLVVVPAGKSRDFINAYTSGKAALYYMSNRVEERLAAFKWVKRTSPQINLQSLSRVSCCSVSNIFIIAFDPKSDFIIRPWLTRHRDVVLGPNDVLAGDTAAAFIDSNPKFYGQQFRVAGILEPSGMGLDETVFIPIETAHRMAEESAEKADRVLELSTDRISAVFVDIKDDYNHLRAAMEIKLKVPGVSVVHPKAVRNKIRQNLKLTLQTLHLSGYAIWPITTLLIGLIFSMSARERRRYIGLLRACGATRWFIFRLIMTEALILCGIGALTGIICSLGIVLLFYRLIAVKLQTPFHIVAGPEILLIALVGLLLAFLTGTVAALAPSIIAGRMDPYDAIRQGER